MIKKYAIMRGKETSYEISKSRMLDILPCEVIVSVIVWRFVSGYDMLWQTGLFLMITIWGLVLFDFCVIYYRKRRNN